MPEVIYGGSDQDCDSTTQQAERGKTSKRVGQQQRVKMAFKARILSLKLELILTKPDTPGVYKVIKLVLVT